MNWVLRTLLRGPKYACDFRVWPLGPLATSVFAALLEAWRTSNAEIRAVRVCPRDGGPSMQTSPRYWIGHAQRPAAEPMLPSSEHGRRSIGRWRMLLPFTMARVVASERPVDRVAEWKSWHAEQDAQFARERDQKRVERSSGIGKSAANRAARAFTDTPTPAFLRASVPCLSHCQAQLRIVRRVRAMP